MRVGIELNKLKNQIEGLKQRLVAPLAAELRRQNMERESQWTMLQHCFLLDCWEAINYRNYGKGICKTVLSVGEDNFTNQPKRYVG